MKKMTLSLLLLVAMLSSQVFAQLGTSDPEADPRVARALDAKGISYTVDSDGDYKIVLGTNDDRTQLAFVRSSTNEYGNMEIREIWSFGYKADGDEFPKSVANSLLEDTFSKKLGAWAKLGNRAVFVVKISANADAESLFNGLKACMLSADTMEEKLTGDTDEF